MERDDLIVNDSYAMAAHHSEEAGAAIRKKIWFVTALLTLITAVEVGMGIIFKRSEDLHMDRHQVDIHRVDFGQSGLHRVGVHAPRRRAKQLEARRHCRPYFLFISYLIFIAITEGFGHLDSFYDVPLTTAERGWAI